MTYEQAQIIEKYFDAGYAVKISYGGYVDSFCTGFYFDEEEENCYVYDSEVFTGQPVTDINIGCVEVFAPVRDLSSKEIDYLDDQDQWFVEKIDGEIV